MLPILTYTPHTAANVTVINKRIVYSDSILSLKQLGKNLKISTISNVGEYSLETCLKIIFESNPNIIFNTIQYSKNQKKVYFYTNQEITTKVYEEKRLKYYKSITSNTEILEETKKILVAEKNKDSDCISLFDISLLLKKMNHKYEKERHKFDDLLGEIVTSNFCDGSMVVVHNFDYQNNVLPISFKRWKYEDFNKIYFSKKNGDLYIVKSESYYSKQLFNVTSHLLTKLYDDLENYSDYKNYKYSSHNIAAVNSNFGVSVTFYGVDIFTFFQQNEYQKDFKLFSPSYSNGYNLDCTSNIVNEAIKNQETEIFKRIFVKIDDCPKWCQRELYKIRQNQLNKEIQLEEERIIEEQRLADEIKYQEMKKQKRLELKRKIFPFIKKIK